MLICFDRQLPETARILAIKGAQVILVPAFGLGIEEINEDILMRARAYENSVYVAHVHPKNTFIVDPDGTIVAQKRGETEEIVMAKITLDAQDPFAKSISGSSPGNLRRNPEQEPNRLSGGSSIVVYSVTSRAFRWKSPLRGYRDRFGNGGGRPTPNPPEVPSCPRGDGVFIERGRRNAA